MAATAPARAPRAALRGAAEAVAVAFTLALATLLRLRVADRELWCDDVGRIRLALLDWDGVWNRLPYLDNLKSAGLVAPHKLWTDIFGSGSLLALRSFGIACGVALVGGVYLCGRRVAGPVAGVAAALLCALGPFFIRWSVEVHNYTPAALAVLAGWWLAAGTGAPGRRSLAAVGACFGYGIGAFPTMALAVLPALLLPRLRRRHGVVGWLVLTGAAAAAAAPGLISLARAAERYAPAMAGDTEQRFVRFYFGLRSTPFEVAGRMFGADIPVGGLQAWHRVWFVAWGIALAATLVVALRTRRRSDGQRTVALVLGALLPYAALVAISRLVRPVLIDRYAFAVAFLLVPGTVWLGVATLRRGLRAAGPGRAGPLALGGALLVCAAAPAVPGVTSMFRDGASFPRAMTSRAFDCAVLLDESLEARPHPDLVVVHGEVQYSQIHLRGRRPEVRTALVRHLSNVAWMQASRTHDLSGITAPPAYGWPFNVEELTGRVVSIDVEEVRAAIRDGREVWLVLENTNPAPNWFLEEADRDAGLGEAFRLANEPAGPERDRALAAAVREYLRLPEGAGVEVWSRRDAVVVDVRPAR